MGVEIPANTTGDDNTQVNGGPGCRMHPLLGQTNPGVASEAFKVGTNGSSIKRSLQTAEETRPIAKAALVPCVSIPRVAQ